MFQNFANYVGSVLSLNQEATTEVVDTNNVRIRSTDENDWVLVDRDSEGYSDASSISSLDDDDEERNEPFQRVILTRSSSTSSLPYPSMMDESWFVTPPPCFTSTGPIQMRTSPLENLLIEHPSMSVYHFHPSRRHLPVAMAATTSISAPSRDSVEDDAEVVVEDADDTRQQLVVDNRTTRLALMPAIQEEQQYLKSKYAQQVQIKKSFKAMNRGNLERNNKAREVNSRNHRQRRGERSQGATRSHANNNRKC